MVDISADAFQTAELGKRVRTNKMATKTILSVDEENYLRMNLLLTGVASRAVRVLFDSEFASSVLKKTFNKERGKLLKLKKKNVIKDDQWTLLFPNQGMYKLLKVFMI